MSTATVTTSEALAWIAELFSEPLDHITPETKREDVANWDSLGLLTMMAELDERFQIILSESDIESMLSVGDLLDCLRKNGKLAD